MHNLTMQHLMTMQQLPQLDRKLLYYGISCFSAIATLLVCVAASAEIGQ